MKTKYTTALPVIILLALASCANKKQKTAPIPPTPVSVTEAQTGEAVYYDRYQGTVVAVNTVELRSQVGGFLTGIFFKDGDVVKKGQPLYEIDRRKYVDAYQQARANVSSAEANLIKAKKDADRYNMLLKNDAVARQTVDQAEATYQTSKSQVAVARAAMASSATDLSYATIRAPFTGRIGISQVKLGTQISVGSTLLNTISSENPVAVDVVINEQDIDRFYNLQKHNTDSTFKLQLSDGSSIYKQPGKVLAIDRGVNNQTGTIKVRIQFPNPNDVLKDGMSCVLEVLNNQSGERVQIPYKAISEQMGEFFVFTQQDTIAKQRKVTLGPRVGANVVVMNGLKAGDKVITDGFQRLRDGGRITLGNPAAQGADGASKSAGGGQSKPANGQAGQGK